MSGSAFVDTNVLIHAHDRSDPVRQRIAADLIAGLLHRREMVTSLQVMREFYVISTRKIAEPLAHEEAVAVLRDLRVVRVFEETLESLAVALEIVAAHGLSLWDALIVASAAAAGCGVLHSEDLSHGQVVRGVRISNPFIRRESSDER